MPICYLFEGGDFIRRAGATLRGLLPFGGNKVRVNPPLRKGETGGGIPAEKCTMIPGGRVGIDISYREEGYKGVR